MINEEHEPQSFPLSWRMRLVLTGVMSLIVAFIVACIPTLIAQNQISINPVSAIAKVAPVPNGPFPDPQATGTAHPTPTGSQTPTSTSTASPTTTPAPGTPTATPTPPRAPTPTPTPPRPPTPTPTPLPPGQFSGLHVQGNKLINSQGQQVMLRGVNRSGSEYACIQGWGFFDGPADNASVQAMANWKINAVRIPMNEDCWLNINGAPTAYSGANYQNAISNFVSLLNQHGIYAVLELHWSAPGTKKATGQAPMPDRDHSITFWSQVANTFKNNTAVLFDLFNEPFPYWNEDDPNGWQCWRDGSTSAAGSCTGTTYNGASYQVAGMQELITAIRNVGAPNVILLGGVQYANTLSHWLNYKPSDPLNNLGASWHVYPVGNICNSTTCYNNQVAPVAASVPLVATEVGESVDDSACSVTNTNIVLNWLDAHQAGYLAWTWDTWGTSCGDLSLILDYSGTPKSPNGTNYKAHLASVTG
jgi:endoglucanase